MKWRVIFILVILGLLTNCGQSVYSPSGAKHCFTFDTEAEMIDYTTNKTYTIPVTYQVCVENKYRPLVTDHFNVTCDWRVR